MVSMVRHQRLLQKLNFYGIRGNILDWITQWLTSRTQRVVVDGEESEHVHVKSGVPQGTVLGPLMFLIYINDIADNINFETHIRLFADDCVLYRAIHSTNDSKCLQEDLDSLTDWATRWQMSFNTAKCSILRVTTKKNPLLHSYKMNNDDLNSVKHHPYLGIELTHNLKWTNHINNITLKANKALWFIRRNLWRCPASIKQQMYFALVRPILEYASVIWDPHTSADIQKVEMVQRRAARFVNNNYKKSEGTVTDLLTKMNWQTLEQRRKNARLIILFKIQNQDIAVPIPDYIQRPKASQTRQYHATKFRVMAPRSNAYKFSFFPRTILDWNSLPSSLLDCKKLDIFKTGLSNLCN